MVQVFHWLVFCTITSNHCPSHIVCYIAYPVRLIHKLSSQIKINLLYNSTQIFEYIFRFLGYDIAHFYLLCVSFSCQCLVIGLSI